MSEDFNGTIPIVQVYGGVLM